MRILQVIPSLNVAGAETMCVNLSVELSRLGEDVSVLCLYDCKTKNTDILEKANIPVFSLGKKPGLDISMISAIRKHLKKMKPDVIHIHLNLLKYVIPAALGLKIKVIMHTVHSVAQHEGCKSDRIVNRIAYKLSLVKPVALSRAIRHTVADVYGIKEKKIPIVYNGGDLNRCKPKESYSIDGHCKILHIGRFAEVKNHAGLIDAFEKVYKNKADVHLWLVGDGVLKNKIENVVKEKHLAENVKFWGVQNSVYDILNSADIFVLPSHYEGIPLTITEAMGSGLPIIATRVGGIPDMIVDGLNGILIEDSPEDLRKAISLLVEDEDLREKLGREALKRSLMFSSATMAEQYRDLYIKYTK